MTYNFCINDFEGPLDLLLHLVKESKMDIYEINIRMIIEQYLEYIHSLKEKNIDIASEYLVMASELVHLKSKMLINKEETEEESDEYNINSEEELRERLIEYEKYKEITRSLSELEEKRSEVYTKIPENLKEFADIGFVILVLSEKIETLGLNIQALCGIFVAVLGFEGEELASGIEVERVKFDGFLEIGFGLFFVESVLAFVEGFVGF